MAAAGARHPVHRSAATELEFDTILKLIAAHAQTSVGRRRLAALAELDDLPDLAETRRNAQLARELEQLLAEDGRISLAGVDDAALLLDSRGGPPQEPEELLCLLALARRVNAVRRRLAASPAELGLVRRLGAALPDLEELVAWVAPRLGRDGRMPDDASPELGRLRRLAARSRQQLLDELSVLRKTHPEAVTDAPPTLRRDRYCLPVRASSRGQLPGLLLDSSGSGATAFVEPYAVVELNNQLADAAAREREEVQRILAEIGAAFAAVADDLRRAVEVLGELDGSQAKVLFGSRVEGRVVDVEKGGDLRLVEARHPLLDERLHGLRVEVFGEGERRRADRRVVPLDLRLPDGVGTLVISGPNAGGKTVALKTVGLSVLMAAHGIPAPLAEGSTIPWFGHLWCHIGDEQDVAADLSTFSAAMTAAARMLRDAGADSLVLYDELGSGTDPLEGAALGCALLEELARRGATTIATTHLAAVALAAGEADGMDNAAMEYDEDRQRPTYTLRVGRPGRSRALEIAATTGVPDPILDRARELLGGQHLQLDRWLERLERLEGELLAERGELARLRRSADDEQRRLAARTEELEAERRSLPEKLAEERERLRERAKRQLDDVLSRLDEAVAERREIGRRQREKLRREALELPLDRPSETPPDDLREGAPVRLAGLGTVAVLEEVRGSRALVTSGGKRLWVPAADLRPAGAEAPASSRVRVDVEDEAGAGDELKLLGLDRITARDELERFLDQALARGRARVRVVHGHGTGALRQVVQEVCREHPAVRAFRHPPQSRGGTGATEIELA